MLFLESFTLPSVAAQEDALTYVSSTNVYPFKLFTKDVPTPEFTPPSRFSTAVMAQVRAPPNRQTTMSAFAFPSRLTVAILPVMTFSARILKQGGFEHFFCTRKRPATHSSELCPSKGVTESVREYSNGENAFLYFTDTIGETGLYLLVEPENSRSPAL